MQVKLIRTTSEEPDFIELVNELDAYLTIVDGEDHEFYDQFNGIDKLKHVVVAYLDDMAVACGSIKHYGDDSVEIKRMYVTPDTRGMGIAQLVLKELESWTQSLGYSRIILETGKRQYEAVAFYKKCGYTITANFGPYKNIENSLCFEKIL